MATPVYTQEGRVVGQIERETYYTTRKRSAHMLRKPPAWAIDRDILLELANAGVQRVEVREVEQRQTYTAQLSDFWRHGIRVNRGFGEQLALPLAYWRTGNRPSQAEQRTERELAAQAQLPLFSTSA